MSRCGSFQVVRLGRLPVETTAVDGRRTTSAAELAHVGLQLFLERGFDETTVDDIAAAAGIGRRTFFRYFASKNDLPWGDFDGLGRMKVQLDTGPDDVALIGAVRTVVIEFNSYPASELTPSVNRWRCFCVSRPSSPTRRCATSHGAV